MKKPNRKRVASTNESIRFLYDRYVGNDPEQMESLEEERTNAEMARKIYELRTRAKLTQAQLAKLVGTTPSVICRLEDADYDGHSLAMLRRIAAALNRRVEVRLVPIRRKRRVA